jgi:glycosyltransferase involved in cell wall biosynthesis
MEQRGAKVFVVAQRLMEACSDPQVVGLESLEDRPSVMMRVRRRVAQMVTGDGLRACLASDIAMTGRRLRKRQGLSVMQMEESFGWAADVVGRCGVPLVVRLHGPWFLNGAALGVPRDGMFRQRVAAEAQAIRRAAGITAPSRAVLEAVREHLQMPLADARVIFNPIDVPPVDQRWSLERCDRGRVVFVGRFDRHKGGDLIIRAMAQVMERMPEARLTFVGPDQGFIDEGGRRWHLAEFIAQHVSPNRRQRIEWLGFQPPERLVEIRRRAHVVVAPSRFEVFGNTVVEAMAMGCPVIVSRTGGFAEIVAHEVSGLHHEPGSADDLAQQIMRMLGNDELAWRVSGGAVEHCLAEHDPLRIADRTLEFYRHVAGS